jgi:hypothetical protein
MLVKMFNGGSLVPGSFDKKKGKQDAIFCLMKDGIFFPPFLSNESALLSAQCPNP